MDREWTTDSGAEHQSGGLGLTAGLGAGAHPRSESLLFRGVNFPVYRARLRARLQAAGLLYVLDGGGEASAITNAAAAVGSGDVGGDAAAGTLPPTERKMRMKAGGAVSAMGPLDPASSIARSDVRAEQDRQRVYGTLIMTLDDAHVAIVTSEVTEGDAAGAWRVLLRMYERQSAASKHHLRRELHRIQLGATESVEAYKARVTHIVGRLKAMKEVVSEGEACYCLLEGLPKEYDIVRQTLEVQDSLGLEQVCSHLRDVQERLKLRDREKKLAAGKTAQQLNATSTSASDGEPVCGLCKKQGHWIGRCYRRKGTAPGECYVCGEEGHSWRDCDDLEKAGGAATPARTKTLNAAGLESDSGRATGAHDSEDDWRPRPGSLLDQADKLRLAYRK